MSDDALVLAAHAWPTNAHLIADVARLGYLRLADRVLDPTHGRGTWWKLWRPTELVTYNSPVDGSDYRQIDEPAASFDAAAYDPPYVCTGGRSTSTIGEFNDRYGLSDTPRRPGELQAMNDAGLAECARVVRPGGVILVKCADYVWSGKVVWGTDATRSAALALGLEVVDRFEHVGHARAQPKRTRADGVPVRQHHARRNVSTLFVLRRPR